MKKKEKLPQQTVTAQQLIGVDEINDNILYTRDKKIFTFIKVRAMGDSLFSEQEKQASYEKLTRELEKEKKPWQLLSIPRVVDTQALIGNLMQIKKQTNNNARLELLDGEIDAVQEMARNGAKEPMILLKLWEKEDKYGERDLVKRTSDIIGNLKNVQGLAAERLTDPDIAFLCKQLAELGIPQDGGDDTAELPVLRGQQEISPDVDLLNEITPIGGIIIKNNQLIIGSAVARVYGVAGYPRELTSGWATDIMNNTEAVTGITFNPGNPHLLAEALARSIKSAAGEAMSAKNVRESKNFARQAGDADAMLDELDANHELIGTVSIITMPFSSGDEGLEEVCKRTTAIFQSHRIRLKVLGQLQREGFQCITPYHEPPRIVDQAFSRLMPLYTLSGGSPMCINSYQDKDGFYFAKTSTGNIVSIDLWHRGGDRTNSNFFVLGKAGMGKSTLIKHIIQMEFMRGTRILIIDPESEYPEITRYLGGIVFNAGGGDAKINILQVRPSPDDDEEEAHRLYSRQQKGNDLAMHLKNVDTIFRTYLMDGTEMLYAVLEQSLIELYGKFGITWETDCRKIPADQFPVLLDLYRLLEEKGGEDPISRELAARLSSAAIGSDSFIFNGHTNLNLDAQIQCFDTNRLQNASDKIKRAQYLNILSLCWEMMSRDRDEKVLLVCDEAYLLVDHNLPQSVMYLRNIEKRCRKFSGALGIATHSVIDLLYPSIRQYGQAILDISTYKFFLAADGQNLKEITELYDLTGRQQNILRAGGRGEALGMLGSNMLHLDFDLPQYKLDNMGKAGGN